MGYGGGGGDKEMEDLGRVGCPTGVGGRRSGTTVRAPPAASGGGGQRGRRRCGEQGGRKKLEERDKELGRIKKKGGRSS